MPESPTPPVDHEDRLIKESEVCRLTSLSPVTRWRLERAGQFPHRRRISPNRVAWSLNEVMSWLHEKKEAAA